MSCKGPDGSWRQRDRAQEARAQATGPTSYSDSNSKPFRAESRTAAKPTHLCSFIPHYSPDLELPWGWDFICLIYCSNPRAWSTGVCNERTTHVMSERRTSRCVNSSALHSPVPPTPRAPSANSASVPFHSLGPDAFLTLLTLAHP